MPSVEQERRTPGIVMPASSAEEAVHAQARATVAVDLGTVIAGMTPEGLSKAMLLGNTTWTLSGYDLTAQTRDGDDYLFDVRYETDIGPLSLRYRFREVEGAWKVVDVDRIS